MRRHHRATCRDGFAVRLAVFYAGLFLAVGIQLPFFPVWLAAKGLDAGAIGVVLATPMIARVLTVPVAARMADRQGALRGALIAISFACTACYALLGYAEGFPAILAALILASVAFTPAGPLADAYALKGLQLRGQAYGPVRLWGSAAFIAGNLGAGFLAGHIAPTSYVWLLVAALAAMAAASLALRPLRPGSVPAAAASEPARLPPASGSVAVAVAASLVLASHAVYYGFSTLEWTASGLGGAAVGSLWALGVVAEIVLFAVSGRLSATLGPRALLGIGAAGAVIRWMSMALDPPTAVLPALQCLHGLSFGATYLGAVQSLSGAASDGRAATVQGDFAMIQGIAMAGAMGLSGLLYGAYGNLAYGAMAACAAAGGAAAALAPSLRRNGQYPNS